VTDSKKLLGATLGTCTLERQIGQGGMGAVYLARQLRPRRSVAVKVLLPGSVLDEKLRTDFLTRFRREADAIALLDHIHIMPVYEYGEQDQLAYLVMPYVAGGTLRQVLNERGSLPLNEALPIIEQAAEALDYAHERGIIHRDIKPGNILFHADGRLLLADFGLAKVLSETTQMLAIVHPEQQNTNTGKEPETASLSSGGLIGTPEYLSPEQALGNSVDERSDIYSLGIVLFQMLSGQVPFTGDTPLATAVMHTQMAPPSLSALVPTLSLKVEAVIARAIAKQPNRRYATAGDFAHALRAAIEYEESERKAAYSGQPAISAFPSQASSNNDTVPEIAQVKTIERTVALDQLTKPEFTVHLDTPYQPALEPPLRRKQSWRVVLFLVILLLALSGGALTYLTVHIAPRHPALAHTTGITPAQTGTSQILQTVPTPMIEAGKNIYTSAIPGSVCPHAQGLWSEETNAQITCGTDATELSNTLTGKQHILAGMFLNSVGGYGIPNDYIVQVETQATSTSQGEFGVLFRNQVNANASSQRHNGAYAFLVSPDGTWHVFVYDDATGAPASIASSHTTVPINGPLTIDIKVQGNTFTFYLNGQKQGAAISGTYATGTIGLAVSTDADVFFKNFALYELS
jgi:serine/threonine protein kinase